MAEVRVAVDGRDDAAGSLWDWLRRVPELRGRLRADEAVVADSAMGVPIELVVAVTAATPAVAMALGRALSTWLVQRRADVTVTLTGPDGRQISLSGQRVADPEKLARTVLDSVTRAALPETAAPTTDSAPER